MKRQHCVQEIVSCQNGLSGPSMTYSTYSIMPNIFRCPDMCHQGSVSTGALIMEIQRRERIILMTPTMGGASCKDTTQMRPCPLLAGSCKQPQWTTGPWSQCQLPSGMVCGQGIRVRAVNCGKPGVPSLPMSECLISRNPIPLQKDTCHIDCSDAQCILSAWTGINP